MAVTVFRDLGYLGFARETTQGTPVAPSSFIKLLKQAFMIEQDFEDIRNGNVQDINNSVKKWLDFKGSFQTYLYPDEGGRLLSGIMGKDVVSGAGDPWTHTLTLLDALPFYTFEADFFSDQIIDRVTDTKLSKLVLACKAGELATLDVDLLGCTTAAQGSPATVTFTDTASEGPMAMHQAAFTLTGPTDVAVFQGQVQEIELTVDRACQLVRGPNSLVPIYVLENARKFGIKMKVAFSGPNIYQLTYFGANAATAPSAVAGIGTLAPLKFTSQAAPEHSISITINNMTYKMAKPEYSKDGKLAIVEVEALPYRSGATLPMTAIVKNGISSQYTV